MAKVSITRLREMKQAGEKIVCLTAYDGSFAQQAHAAGVDVLLVGDSLGMVVQGRESTVPVALDEMIYHTQCVRRGCPEALVIADMPFMSANRPEQALENAGRLMKEGGAQVVKLEGGDPDSIEAVRLLSRRSIPVCAHLGLLPQSVYKLGGYRIQGKTEDDAERILNQALALQEAGADVLVLECVPAALAKRITQQLDIPTIGIGAGVDTDGQVLVIYDMLGITPGKRPKFSKDFLHENGTVAGAIAGYVEEVKSRRFPTLEHSF